VRHAQHGRELRLDVATVLQDHAVLRVISDVCLDDLPALFQ